METKGRPVRIARGDYRRLQTQAKGVEVLTTAAIGHTVQVDGSPDDGFSCIAKQSLSAPLFWAWYFRHFPQWHPTPVLAAVELVKAWKRWRTDPMNPGRE